MSGRGLLLNHAVELDAVPPEADARLRIVNRPEPELRRSRRISQKTNGESMTVGEVAQRHGESVSLPQFVGTPASVADQLEAFFDEVGGDGFMLSPIYCPGAIGTDE